MRDFTQDLRDLQREMAATRERLYTLSAEAETALNEDRYDTDRPRSLAIEARYEALHALHVAKLVKMTEDKVMSREDLILAAEEPVARIAGALDLKAEFDEGFTKPTETIVTTIADLEAERDDLLHRIQHTYDNAMDPRYAAARLWVDGIIDPVGTFYMYGLASAIINHRRGK